MKKRVGLIGSVLLGAAIVTVGLFIDLALAQSLNGCGPSGNTPKKCDSGSVSVPEPASLLLLGAGVAGFAIWKRKSKKD